MKKYLIALFAFAMLLTSCDKTNSSNDVSSQVTSVSVITEQPSATVTTTTAEPTESKAETTLSEPDEPVVETAFPTTNFEDYKAILPANKVASDCWEEAWGAYAEVNGNVPFFGEDDKKTVTAFETYSELDGLGRCGTAYANVCKEIMPTEKRGEIGMIKPSGWQTSKYDKSVISDMYLYNRCHLIAYMLAGENANEQNLITGTRYLNITGMLPFEDKVHDYIEDNPNNHVLYRVTPAYRDNDLVAQGVLMEAWSVEDNGALSFCVWCYNVQPKITIIYSDGNNYLYAEEDTSVADKTDTTYILNTNSKKIHRTDCKAVKDIKESNKQQTDATLEELKKEGYTPCGICKP